MLLLLLLLPALWVTHCDAVRVDSPLHVFEEVVCIERLIEHLFHHATAISRSRDKPVRRYQ
jgi:hypothetical protein